MALDLSTEARYLKAQAKRRMMEYRAPFDYTPAEHDKVFPQHKLNYVEWDGGLQPIEAARKMGRRRSPEHERNRIPTAGIGRDQLGHWKDPRSAETPV